MTTMTTPAETEMDLRPARLQRVPVRELLAEVQETSINDALDSLAKVPNAPGKREREEAFSLSVLRAMQANLSLIIDRMEGTR